MKVAASSWFHSPRRLAISQAASGRKSAVSSGSACGRTLRISASVGDVELVGDRRALEAEVEAWVPEREEGDGADEEDRQLARLDVDPAREAGALGGRDRHRGAGDEAGDAGGAVQGEDQRVAPEDRQQVAGSEGSVRPGRWIGVRSGVSSPATTQTAPSRASAIARLSAIQPRSTAQGRSLQDSRVSRVSRIPCENTCWLAALIAQVIGRRTVIKSGAEGARTPDLRAASATLFQLSYSPRSATEFIGTCAEDYAARCSGPCVLVDVEDQVVRSGAADLEVERRVLFQLAQQVDRLVEAHRERRPALGEALDRDLGGAEPADRVLEADQLGEVAERADLELDRPS